MQFTARLRPHRSSFLSAKLWCLHKKLRDCISVPICRLIMTIDIHWWGTQMELWCIYKSLSTPHIFPLCVVVVVGCLLIYGKFALVVWCQKWVFRLIFERPTERMPTQMRTYFNSNHLGFIIENCEHSWVARCLCYKPHNDSV